MSDEEGTYRTLKTPVEGVILKERKSKFIGYAYPVQTEQDIKVRLEALKQIYPDANHICYAWKLGVKNPTYRVQDDGEPRNSAGIPIYGQINSLELTNVVVFVVRYFGGVKLGVGGLISSYKETARNTLDLGNIAERFISSHFRLSFDYSQMNTIQRLISRMQLNTIERQLEEKVVLIIEVPLTIKTSFLEAANSYYLISVEEM